jgi:Na+-translocating ferredoxin:NAD+ oxidoreductase RnfG subunit
MMKNNIEKEDNKRKNNSIAFIMAKQTKERQFLEQYSEECNDPTEECDIDNVYVYALPSGNIEKIRIHTF